MICGVLCCDFWGTVWDTFGCLLEHFWGRVWGMFGMILEGFYEDFKGGLTGGLTEGV
jgi:hypothetical protein